MYVYMTKVISISDKAYSELSKLKDNLSFSSIILNLTNEKNKESLMECAGTWDKKESERIKEELMKERKIKSRRMN